MQEQSFMKSKICGLWKHTCHNKVWHLNLTCQSAVGVMGNKLNTSIHRNSCSGAINFYPVRGGRLLPVTLFLPEKVYSLIGCDLLKSLWNNTCRVSSVG